MASDGRLDVMTGADGGGAASDVQPERRWDVALSFAGAQRDYVGQVAQELKARGVRCFYDIDEQVRLWGRNLAEELPRIYAFESAAVVVFISADYAAGDWTRLERRAAFSRAVTEAGVRVLPARFDDSELPGLLPDVVTVDLRSHAPWQFADLVLAALADLAISPSLTPGRSDHGQAAGVRVSEADPRRLGVHAAISTSGIPDGEPPEYVPRDVDSDVRALVAAAQKRGGFVLLVGGSSVGKTRCALEAVTALLPDWWLVHPAGPGEVAALAAAPSPRMVVWLDELQRYLDGGLGLTGGVVRTLLNHSHPAVIIGTLWPNRYAAYTILPPPDGADPHAREREVLDLANVVRIGPEFSPAEQNRARAAATRDPRLAAALKATGYGLTQTLAAAPQLVARWQDAQTVSPYGWAVLTAALDAARLGARAPLSADFLRAAAPGYCTSQQQAEAPNHWFEQAVAYATIKLHGAAAALSPSGASMGQITGYTVADYLLQQASLERRCARVPATTWDAILSYLSDPVDMGWLADSASDRLLYRYAIPLYRRAADADDEFAAVQLADLLAKRGDLDGAVQMLRAPADHGDPDAVTRLAELLVRRGDLDELRARADRGDQPAARGLARLLAERGDLDELRVRADRGDQAAAARLGWLLVELGDLDGAVQMLRAPADRGDRYAAERLAELLAERGDLDELRVRADRGDQAAATRLADLLIERGDLDELRARADRGDQPAATRLADLLIERGDPDGAVQMLRVPADRGDRYAAARLTRLLVERGDLDELRARADNRDRWASRRLATLLVERGDLDELRARADNRDGPAAARLAGLLAERGDLDELRARADNGDGPAALRLAGLLAERGDLDELRARAEVGDRDAAQQLPGLLTKQGRGEEAQRLRRFGLNPDGSTAHT